MTQTPAGGITAAVLCAPLAARAWPRRDRTEGGHRALARTAPQIPKR